MHTLELLAQRILGVDRADVEGARAAQDRHVVDAIGAGFSAASIFDLRQSLPMLRRYDRTIHLAAAIRASEVDDIDLASLTTPSSVVVPIALQLAASGDVNPIDIRAGLLAGMDTLVGFGRAVGGPNILYRDFWPTALAAPLGAAAIIARARRYDVAQTMAALTLALCLGSGVSARFPGKLSPRWLLHANAVHGGVLAALSAEAGYEAVPDILDGDWLQNTRGLALDAEQLFVASPREVYRQISMKPFCSARQSLGVVTSFLDLLASGIDVGQITKLEARLPPALATMVDRKLDLSQRSSTFVSLQYQLALAAICPDALHSIDRVDMPDDAAIRDFMERVTIVADPALASEGPWAAKLATTTHVGTITVDASTAWGEPGRPLDDLAVAAKFQRLAARIQGDSLFQLASGVLDSQPSAQALLKRFSIIFDPDPDPEQA